MSALKVHIIVHTMTVVTILLEVSLVLAKLATVEMESHVEVKLYKSIIIQKGFFSSEIVAVKEICNIIMEELKKFK